MPVKAEEVNTKTEKTEPPVVVARQEASRSEIITPPGDAKPPNKSFFSFFRHGHNLQDQSKPENQLQVDTIKTTVKHPLSEDCHTPVPAALSAEHAIAQDSRVSKIGVGRFSEHLMEYDRRTTSTVPSIHVSHHLATDPTFVRANTIDSKHGLDEDEPNASKQYNAGISHALESHDLATSSGESRSETIEGVETSPHDKGFVASLLSGIPNPLGGSTERPALKSDHTVRADGDEKET